MNHLLKTSLFAISFLFLVSCGTDSDKEAQLQGTWNASYIERGGEEVTGQTVAFTFEGSDYIYTAGGYKEEGQFWVEGDKLYTEGAKVLKKSVEIEKLTADSLVLGMNDKGVPMRMVFVK